MQAQFYRASLISEGHKLLVTGASGFVGRALSLEAAFRGLAVRAANCSHSVLSAAIECVSVGDIDDGTDWHNALTGCDVVVHLAARAHVMHDDTTEPLVEFCKVNVGGTLNLARQAENI